MITKTIYRSRAEWLKYRNDRFLVGSSNVGIILGLCKYKTPLQYWDDIKNKRDSDTQNIHRGRFMEDGIARWFAHETGLKIIKRSSEITVYHNSDYPSYFQATPDRELFAERRECRPLLECKDTGMHINFDDPESVPLEWYTQIQFQMMIAGRKIAYLAVNDGSKQMKWRMYRHDAEFCSKMAKNVIEWVDRHIIREERPEPTTADDINMLYPESQAGVVRVGNDINFVREQLFAAQQRLKQAQKETDELKRQLILQFGAFDTLEYEGAPIATYRTVRKKFIDADRLQREKPEIAAEYSKESMYRTLKLK